MNLFTGRMNLAPYAATMGTADLFQFTNNRIRGVRHSLYTTNELESIPMAGGGSYYAILSV